MTIANTLDLSFHHSPNARQIAYGVTRVTSAYRIEAVLSEAGKLLLDHLRFRAGQRIEVIIHAAQVTSANPTLRGTVLRYDQPAAPSAESDWDALQ